MQHCNYFSFYRHLHVPSVPVALARLEGLGVRHRVLEVLAGGHGWRPGVPVRVDHGDGLTDVMKDYSENMIHGNLLTNFQHFSVVFKIQSDPSGR